MDAHQTTFWKHHALVVTGLGSNGDRSWGTRDVRWDGRIAIVARVWTHGQLAPLLTQADEPPLVAGDLRLATCDLRLLSAKRLAVA